MTTASPTSVAEKSSTVSRAAAHSVQAKLSVSQKNDTYEQEADRTADVVVNHSSSAAPHSAAVQTGSNASVAGVVATRVAPKISRLIDRAPQRKLQLQEDEEAQTKVQRQEDEEAQTKVQRQEDEEAQTKVQRQEDEETQTKVQRQEDEEAQTKVQRQEDEEAQTKVQRQEEEKAQAKVEARPNVRDKQRSPELGQVEGKLFSNKGKGEPLDDTTRVSMEAGFGADFSGVKIHTGADAVAMSRDLNAQAFTHGKDVFFNSGKFEPDIVRGKILLAHELTHVVQQGAADQRLGEGAIAQNNAKKDQLPPKPLDKEAKSVEETTKTKIEQNEPQTVEKPPVEASSESTGEATAEETKTASADEAAPTEEGKSGEGDENEKASKGQAGKSGKKSGKKGKAAAKAEGGGVGAFLKKMTNAIFQSKKAKVTQLAKKEKTTDAPETKLEQTQKSVIPPAEESQSRAKAGQVSTVEQVKAPEPDEAQAKQQFNTALDNAVPTSLEEVDEFKEQGKGRMVGEAVKGVVTADTQQVKGTYQEIDNPPASQPPEQSPQELPAMEEAPETGAIAMGEGVVGEVQPEHTDLTEFDQSSDQLLQEEGITDEQLEMVDEGDLAEAKQDRKTVKTQVKEGPKEVKQLERQEKQQVNQALQKEEEAGRQEMRGERQKELRGARDDQQKTKSAIELKRQKVTEHINGIYQKANDTVKQKLNDLETKSMRAFDESERQATQTFEGNVKRRIDGFKKRRYDRWGGSLLWLKDKLLGMDDLPEVKNIFDNEKSQFITNIDSAIKNITEENKRVIQECKDIVATAKTDIDVYVQGLGPELQKTGQQAMTDIKGKLDALDKKINDKAKELQKKLAAKREAAIKAIEEKIEKMKEAMSGLISKLGNLLLNAMLKFFKWGLKKAGFSPDELMAIINKGKVVIKKIVTDPIGFIGNIIKAVKGGIDLFKTNIKKHLIGGLISWLTGAMADVPITLPKQFDLKGILHLVLQILGLTWDRIRQKLVERVGEKVVKIAETSVDIVRRLITEGPMALWEMIKDKAEEIKNTVMNGIRNWVITEVVKQGIIKLVSFLNPAGAIIQAIIAIYNTVMFFVENIKRIIEMVKTVFNSIGNIAMGKISAAAQAVESAMARTIPIILNFIARLLGLSGIGKAITDVIKKIREPIDKIVNKVLDSVVAMAKKLLGKGKAAGKAIKEKGKSVIKGLVKWVSLKASFKTKDNKSHKVFIDGQGKKSEIMVASQKEKMTAYFARTKDRVSNMKDGKEKNKLGTAVGLAESHYDLAIKEKDGLTLLEKQEAVDKKVVKKKEQTIRLEFREVGKQIKILGVETIAGLNLATKITPSGGTGGTEKITADPLTPISGNTKGSPPQSSKTEPPGWSHLVKVHNAKPELNLFGNWLRMHLIHEEMHGPGKSFNLVPTPTRPNNLARDQAEHPALKKLADPEAILWYQTTVIYHSGSGSKSYLKHFPNFITMEWKKYSDFEKNEAGPVKKSGPFEIHESEVPSLSGVSGGASSRLQLRNVRQREFTAIAKQMSFLSQNQAIRLHSAYSQVVGMPSKIALGEYYREKIQTGGEDRYKEHHIEQDWQALQSLSGKKVDIGQGDQTIDIK